MSMERTISVWPLSTLSSSSKRPGSPPLVPGRFTELQQFRPSLDYDETTQRWVAEDCPERPLPEEATSDASSQEETRKVPNVEPVLEETPDPELGLFGAKLATVDVQSPQ
jgi:hypothetical protein